MEDRKCKLGLLGRRQRTQQVSRGASAACDLNHLIPTELSAGPREPAPLEPPAAEPERDTLAWKRG